MSWTPEIKAACREHCACYGEPPCFEIDDAPPCDDCVNLRENPDWQTDDATPNPNTKEGA